MSIAIPSNYLTYQQKSSVQAYCKSFFEQFGFSYFQYLRCFNDGSIALLTNETGLLDYFLQRSDEPVVFSAFDEQNNNSESFWFTWDESLPVEPVGIVRKHFNIHHGLTYVRRSKRYYDMIAVGLPQHTLNAHSFYFNKFSAIKA